MEGRLLLKGCSILGLDGQLRTGRTIVIEGRRITRVAPEDQLPTLPGDWEVPCAGRVVVPGFVDGHAHLVGGLVAPLSSSLLLATPQERFEVETARVRTLSAQEVEVVTAFATARAMRSGITTVVEHLCHDGELGAILKAQATAAERVGIRFVVAPALSSHSPTLGAQLEATAELARASAGHPTVRGALGFYASFAADDDLLGRLARTREELDAPIHFHLAEGEDDLALTFARLSQRIVPRLRDYGLLGARTIAAFGRALDRAEVAELARLGAFVATTPLFDLTGERASGGFEALFTHPTLLGLGSAGTPSLHEQLSAALAQLVALARLGRIADPDQVAGMMLSGGAGRMVSRVFGNAAGEVEPGALADLVVFDLIPPHGEGEGRPIARRWFEVASSPVAWVIVDGRVTVREGQLIGADFLELSREAAKVLGRFH